ncbi:MAG: Hsp20/alpha crystallin family protein [Planctomycetia bacterium]|nr:Hsp20/alpha crystallin family protein [Planctomycetia bacterium]
MTQSSTTLEPTSQPLRTWRGPATQWRSELRELISNFFNDTGDGIFTTGAPSLDLSETAETVQVRMDAPGVKPDDLDIRIAGNLLTISGKREEEKEEKDRTFHRLERSCGSFTRTVTLPCEVDQAKVDAQYREGILTVSMPKTVEAKALKIKVKS